MTASVFRRRALAAATAVILLVGLVFSLPLARAQTLPDPPPESEPVVDLAGPAVQGVLGPACSSLAGGLALGFVVAGATGEAGSQINPIYQEILTAQVTACGLVPPQPSRTTCGPEADAGDAVADAAAPASEAGAPVDPATLVPKPRAAGGAVRSAQAAEEAVAANGAPSPGAGDEVASALSCETVVVGGEYVPGQFSASPSATASSATPLDVVGGPAPGPVDAPVATTRGGSGTATGALTTSASPGPLAGDSASAAPAESALAAPTAAESSAPTGKIAVLVAISLLAGLSFIPTRPRV